MISLSSLHPLVARRPATASLSEGGVPGIPGLSDENAERSKGWQSKHPGRSWTPLHGAPWRGRSPENNGLRRDSEAGALDRPGDGGDVGLPGQAHLAALEIDGDWRGAGAGGGPGDGLDAAVAIHAGDLEDEFFSHVI